MYKLTRPDGFDFYSGTINYRENIGKVIWVVDFDPPSAGSCGRGLHASKNPNYCFVGAQIPCAAFRVKGISPIAKDAQKTRYQALQVIEEIMDLDKLFGWKYSEVVQPINPFQIKAPKITDTHIKLLTDWASVWASVRASVMDSVWASVRASVGASVMDSVRASVGASVMDSVWASVWASVRASVWAYMGSLFPNIKVWKYTPKTQGYPFRNCVDLWRSGLVASNYGNIWRLHGGPKATILWEQPFPAAQGGAGG